MNPAGRRQNLLLACQSYSKGGFPGGGRVPGGWSQALEMCEPAWTAPLAGARPQRRIPFL